jgi:hypothetical protein
MKVRKVSEWDPLRENFRKQLVTRYKNDFRNGFLTLVMVKQMVSLLELALEKAKRTKQRVVVEGQEDFGTLGVKEIEDQLFALREIVKE